MTLSDEMLVQACRKGDETAWEALVNRYQRLIYTIPRRAGLDEDQAAEVFQDVFTTLLRKLEEIEQPERLHAWIVTTARRVTWRLIKREKNPGKFIGYGEEGEEDEAAQVPSDAPLPDEVLLQLEEQQRIRRAVATLDDRCRKLIQMLFYQPVSPSYTEIAAALGTTEGSIGPTRARCLQKMLRLLEN
ncbi:MAG: sigma-70 family RNA polymerase sigma factor [Pyrinomonadaceae bacterium]|nr:sigma-70 family RNA polymerase sigma factor [Pyrinomonadaceae bacterium]